MNDIWLILVPFLIVDIVNPVLFAFMVYAVGTKRAVVNSSAILLGHTLAYFCAGLVLAFGSKKIIDRLEHPQVIDFVFSLLIGILLLWVAFYSTKSRVSHNTAVTDRSSAVKMLGLGAIVNFIGIPFALPYFAVIHQILKANLNLANSITVLIVYNLLYALPFLLVPILSVAMGKRSALVLQRINKSLEQVGHYLMPLLLALAGVALVSDTIYFFITGTGLF